jgi:hypothetical protein
MKYLVLIFLIIFCTALRAQDYDSTFVEESESYPDHSEVDSEDSEDAEYTYEEEDDKEVHVLIQPDVLPTTDEYKSEKIFHKNFDENNWRKIVGDKDFAEDEPDAPKLNMPNMAWSGELLKGIAYTFIVALVLLLLYYVFKNVTFSTKRTRAAITPYSDNTLEDIHELDIEGLLRQAMAERNFKMAVRFYFLSLLKNLNDAGLIKWEKDKTNREYLSELFSKDLYYNDVKKLTRGYEEVWYGDHPLPEESLLFLITEFQSVNEKLNVPKA